MRLLAIIGLLLGFILCLVTVIVLIELFCWKTRRNRLGRPYLASILSSVLVGTLIVISVNINSNGESGLVFMFAYPFILIGSVLGGVPIGALYRKIDRTLIIKKPKEPVIKKKFSVRL